jgi:hypothetical protein
MATNFDKSLYQDDPLNTSAPDSMDAIEIQIEDGETDPSGDVTIVLEEETTISEDFNANLADDMDESELTSLADEIDELVTADINSRKDWADTYVRGLEVLGLKYEQRTEPWDGASGVFHPMITEAVVRFQSETITETFPAQEIGRAHV